MLGLSGIEATCKRPKQVGASDIPELELVAGSSEAMKIVGEQLAAVSTAIVGVVRPGSAQFQSRASRSDS